MAEKTKKPLTEILAQQININKSGATTLIDNWLATYSKNILATRIASTRISTQFRWRDKEDADTVIILVGPRQCGKTRYLRMWQAKHDIPLNLLYIMDIQKEISKYQNKYKDGHIDICISYILNNIEHNQRFYTIIENSYFKTNDEYINLIKKFKHNTKFEFHFWGDGEKVFAKPDPVAMCFLTGYQNITVKEHFSKNNVNPYHKKETWKKGRRE